MAAAEEEKGIEPLVLDREAEEEEARELRQSLRKVVGGSYFTGIIALGTLAAAIIFYLAATDVIEMAS